MKKKKKRKKITNLFTWNNKRLVRSDCVNVSHFSSVCCLPFGAFMSMTRSLRFEMKINPRSWMFLFFFVFGSSFYCCFVWFARNSMRQVPTNFVFSSLFWVCCTHSSNKNWIHEQTKKKRKNLFYVFQLVNWMLIVEFPQNTSYSTHSRPRNHGKIGRKKNIWIAAIRGKGKKDNNNNHNRIRFRMQAMKQHKKMPRTKQTRKPLEIQFECC